MLKRFLCVAAVTALMLFTSCAYDYDFSPVGTEGEIEEEIEVEFGEREIITSEDARERLLGMGWETEWLETLGMDDSMLISMYNQSRFFEYTDRIYDGRPIGASGEIIAPQYFGGLKFDEMGFLVVSVLSAGFDDYATAAAIAEMLEKGIIIRRVQFNHRTLMGTIDRLNDMIDDVFAAGASSWGMGAENAITVWLDPYTDEQKAIFNDFLIANGIDPAVILIQQAVTQEMLDWRAERVAAAAASSANLIVPVRELKVSRTGIAFSLQNTTGESFNYGSPWDLAYYENGNWLPVPHLPGAGGGDWTSIGFSLQGGGIQQYHIGFEWHFGELSPGRYMFMRDGWLGEWNPDQDSVYALVEFEITPTTPISLPPAAEEEWPVHIEVVEVSNVTSTGMNVVIENVSPYDIDNRIQIIFIVPAEHTTVGEHWEWWEHHLPFLSFDDHMQGFGYIPSGERAEFELYLGNLFGELAPGDYKISLSIGGQAAPPHPTGWAFGDALLPFTIN